MTDRTASEPKTSSTSPCAACKIQRKKCSEKCVLAPYFPQNNPEKFLLVHRVFGNSNIIKLLQGSPAEKRGDTVSSMVYEASQRVRDPVHGCLGVIKDLQSNVSELQSKLASTEAEIARITLQHANLLTIITGYHVVSDPIFDSAPLPESENKHTNSSVSDNIDSMQLWEPLWS